MSSILKVNTIQDTDGNNIINENANVITIGASGDTITVPAGATLSTLGTNTFASLGVTGDLTVDTNTLFVKSSTNRVGIGTTTPLENLTVESSSFPIVAISNNSATNPTNGVALDLIERNQPSVVFGEAGCYGFRQFLDGNANRFDIISGNQATTNTRLSIERDTGNIGIGTTSPASLLHVTSSTSDNRIQLTNSSSSDGSVNSGASIQLNATSLIVNNNEASGDILFRTDGFTERMRINSIGDVFVSKTARDFNTDGVELRNDGKGAFTISGDVPLVLNRRTNDGYIQQWRKDNTTIGSIYSTSGRIIIGSGNTGLRLDGTADAMVPRTGANGLRTNTIDLGDTANTFKDLYLGGGLYVGGTVAANKLDDYEEGTWTPSTNIGYATITSATYTKVGNMVTVQMNVTTNAGPGDVSQATSVSGLPFSTSVSPQISFNNMIYGLDQDIFCEISGSSFAQVDRANNTAITRGEYGSRLQRITITYLTS